MYCRTTSSISLATPSASPEAGNRIGKAGVRVMKRLPHVLRVILHSGDKSLLVTVVVRRDTRYQNVPRKIIFQRTIGLLTVLYNTCRTEKRRPLMKKSPMCLTTTDLPAPHEQQDHNARAAEATALAGVKVEVVPDGMVYKWAIITVKPVK